MEGPEPCCPYLPVNGPYDPGPPADGCLRDYGLARHLVEEDRLIVDKTGLLEFHCPGSIAIQHGFHPLGSPVCIIPAGAVPELS